MPDCDRHTVFPRAVCRVVDSHRGSKRLTTPIPKTSIKTMVERRQGKDFIQGVPELLVLQLLREREMYGYEIIQSIRLRSDEVFRFGEGVIYPLLHSLQKRRLVAIRRVKVQGRPRVYYRLTSSGKKKLANRISDWNRVSGAIHNILTGPTSEA